MTLTTATPPSKIPSPPLYTSRRPSASISPRTTDPEAALDPTCIAPPPYNPWIPGFRNPPPFKLFLKRNWLDILTQLLCLLAAFCIYTFVPPLMPRYFAMWDGVETSEWGVRHSAPLRTEYVNTWVSAVGSYFVPVVVMGAVGLWGTRDFEDGNAGVSPISPFPYCLRHAGRMLIFDTPSKSVSATPSAP
jgi:diacylglycerol diphosphate phosphatase/phosphatidate phosphatase